MVQSRRIDSNLVFADRFEHQRILSAAGSIRSTDTQRAWRFVPARHWRWPLQSDDKTPTPGCVTKISDRAKSPVLEASLTSCIASSA
jgi:hypothetical protein